MSVFNRFFGGSSADSTALGRPRTYFHAVLDDSGSMMGAAATTRQAYNDFIAGQKRASAEAKDEVFVSLTKFAGPHEMRTLYNGIPLAEVPQLTEEQYRASGGSTALYDAVSKAITDVERRVGTHARVLMLVITDGDENASLRTNGEQVRRMVEQRHERGNWTFVFLSAGTNPYAAGQRMGFKPGNIRSYQTSKDVGQSLVHVGQAVRSYRHSDDLQTETFFQGAAPKHDRPNWTTAGTDDVEDVV